MVGEQKIFRDESIDEDTPPDVPLSGRYKRGFAYPTIKDRLPVILTKIVDLLYRDKNKICEEYGEDAKEEIKEVIGGCSKLRNELQTNKVLTPISTGIDQEIWNKCIGSESKWFYSPWLLVECYFYRRIKHIFESSSSLKSFDPFGLQKNEAFINSLPAIKALGHHLLASIENPIDDIKSEITQFIKVALWGNKCDLSISAGEKNDQQLDPVNQIDTFEPNILVNDIDTLWDHLSVSTNKTIDIVLDNSGFELFTDLCLADILITRKIANKIRFHVKAIPWFVSDVTTPDFYWTIKTTEDYLPELSTRWNQYLNNAQWQLQTITNFWTLPHSFTDMKQVDPELYETLSNSAVVIYKGDLNYRKLVGDLNWKPETTFDVAIKNTPRPLLTLRTLKADVVVGLPEGKAKELTSTTPNWMISGDFAVIQFALQSH